MGGGGNNEGRRGGNCGKRVSVSVTFSRWDVVIILVRCHLSDDPEGGGDDSPRATAGMGMGMGMGMGVGTVTVTLYSRGGDGDETEKTCFATGVVLRRERERERGRERVKRERESENEDEFLIHEINHDKIRRIKAKARNFR